MLYVHTKACVMSLMGNVQVENAMNLNPRSQPQPWIQSYIEQS